MTGHQPPLLIVAYALAPGPGGAEALVNLGLVEALRAAGDQVAVVAAASGRGARDGASTGASTDTVHRVAGTATGRPALDRVTRWLDAPRRRPTGAAARLVDRSRSLAGMAPVRSAAWGHAAGREAAALRERTGWHGAVVWARATPPESFEAAIRAHRAQPFPLLANYNDPMPPGPGGTRPALGSTDRALRNLQRRQNRYLAHNADAWTFPSAALRDLMVARAGLDPRRCFVIPHLVPGRPASPRRRAGDPPRLLYAGTLYQWVFTEPLSTVLTNWLARGRLSLVVAATGADDEQVRALHALVPGVEVHRDLGTDRLDALVDDVDALLVVDNRPPLLPTKVVDGICRLRPLLAVAPPGSTTSVEIGAAGGLTADRADAAEIDTALGELIALVTDPAELAATRRVQSLAAERFSPDRVLTDIRAVIDFAAERFLARATGRPEPAPPVLPASP